jgi:acyl-CoA synthetase (AMP-forming)/AMP-acid ligase II
VHRGALVALGYWNDAARTALRFRPPPGDLPVETGERAVWSGDLVRTDEDGFLYFVGRNDEMIKTSGYRVSPTEIEEIAFRSGLVRDAVALGDEDPALGQRIILVVTPSAPGHRVAEGLQRYFRRNAPGYMVPAVVDERTSIPRGPNGKYDRTWLREERAS